MNRFKRGFVKNTKILQVTLQVIATENVNLVTDVMKAADKLMKDNNDYA
jgi:hypothetical protein